MCFYCMSKLEPKTRICASCEITFILTASMRPNRKFCSRECYRISCRKFESVPYPMVWYKGKREYLHRVIYMEHHNVVLKSDDIIHHIDENPFNRDISNLELLNGKGDHLHKHDYFRKQKQMKKDPRIVEQWDDDIPF